MSACISYSVLNIWASIPLEWLFIFGIVSFEGGWTISRSVPKSTDACQCYGKKKNAESLLFAKDSFVLFLSFSRAAPAAYGGSQTRGRIGARVAGLRHSYSNGGTELRLLPTLQVTATLYPTERGQGSNPQSHGSQSDSLTTEPRGGTPTLLTNG